jgi:hypothetical protein
MLYNRLSAHSLSIFSQPEESVKRPYLAMKSDGEKGIKPPLFQPYAL